MEDFNKREEDGKDNKIQGGSQGAENPQNETYQNGEKSQNEGQNSDNAKYSGNLNDIFGQQGGNRYQNAQNPYWNAQNPYQFQQNPYQNNQYNGNNAPNNMYNGMAGRIYPTSNYANRFVKVFVSIFLAVILFVGGFLTAYVFAPSEEEKLTRWIKSVAESYYYNVDGSEIDFTQSIGNAMVGSLDQFSSFYASADLEKLYEENQGIYKDTGMILVDYNDGGSNKVIVLKVYGESPAYKAGVRVGDIIKTIENEDMAGKTAAQVRSAVSQKLSGGEGAQFVFSRIIGSTETTLPAVAIKQEQYNPKFSYYYDSSSEGMEDVLSFDTAYITFEEFSTNADTQFAENLAKFKENGKKKLILDMRTNFGGSLAVLQNVASHLITDKAQSKNVLIINAEYKDMSRTGFKTTDNLYSSYEFEKIVVLANGYSASATEVLICAMKDYGTLTALVGTKTYGKAVMQSYFEYAKKYGMYVTTAKLYSPITNVSYNLQGFTPDGGETAFNLSGTFVGDAQLIRAKEIIDGGISL